MIIINNLLLRAAYLFFSDFKLLLKSGNLACIQESYFSPFPQSNQFTLNAWSNQDFKVSKRKIEWFLENMSSYGKFWLHKRRLCKTVRRGNLALHLLSFKNPERLFLRKNSFKEIWKYQSFLQRFFVQKDFSKSHLLQVSLTKNFVVCAVRSCKWIICNKKESYYGKKKNYCTWRGPGKHWNSRDQLPTVGQFPFYILS